MAFPRDPDVRFADAGRTVILGNEPPRRKVLLRPRLRRLASYLPVLFVVAYVAYGTWVRADAFEYYPGSCLGTWERVENILGEPELEVRDVHEFSLENSAHYAGGDTQVFCGNFFHDERVSRERIFKKATISFIWAFRNADGTPAGPVPDETSLELTLPNVPAISESTSTASSSADSVQATSSSDADTSLPTWPTENFVPLEPDPTLTNVSTSDPAPIPQPEPDPVPTFMPTSSPTSTTARTWLWQITPFAFAQTASSAHDEPPFIPVSDDTFTIDSPTADEAPSGTPAISEASSSGQGEEAPTSTLEIPFDVIQPQSADDAIYQGAEGDLLHITYSLDGETWSLLSNVNENNWQDATFSLEILSWDDLRKLQISVRGFRTNPMFPEIYLDGIRIEVEAERPDWLTDFFTDSAPLPSPEPLVADPEALHRCAVEPFSRFIPRGGSATYRLVLTPSDANLGYQLSFGDIPHGVEPGLVQTTSTTELILRVDSEASTTPGSFNNIIVYEEVQSDGRRIPIFCQYNLVVE